MISGSVVSLEICSEKENAGMVPEPKMPKGLMKFKFRERKTVFADVIL